MGAQSLSYAVRYRVVLTHLGELSLALAVLTALPLAVALWFGDYALAVRYTIVVTALAGGGVLLARLPKPPRLQSNEGMVLVALTFLVAPLAMVYPMMASGLRFEDALFEAVSGVTTTGLTTIADPGSMSPSFLFARAWMQWYGGLGIVALSLAFVVNPGLAAKGLAVNEPSTDDLAGGTRAYARRVTVVYAILTAGAIVLFWLLGLAPFDAIVYALAAVSTGGFAPYRDSLAGLQSWWSQAAVTLACLAGAVAIPLYYKLVRDRQHTGAELVQLFALLALCALASVAVGLALWGVEGMGLPAVFREAPLLALSAQSTAGFSSLPVAQLHDATKLALIPEMVIGGSLGSTAGGFKILRLLLLLRLAQAVIARARSAPHAVIDVRLAGNRIEESALNGVLLMILLYVIVILLSWMPFVVLDYPPLDALFEVVSATGTVGLSAGVTGAALPTALKGVLCADMLLGRLEIICWLVALHPGTWIGRRLPLP